MRIKNAKLIYKNFSGERGVYAKYGIRNFGIIVDDEDVDTLIRQGWNIKCIRDTGIHYFLVTVAADAKVLPKIEISNTIMSIDNIYQLDENVITDVEVSINPYDFYYPDGTRHVKAYLEEFKGKAQFE